MNGQRKRRNEQKKQKKAKNSHIFRFFFCFLEFGRCGRLRIVDGKQGTQRLWCHLPLHSPKITRNRCSCKMSVLQDTRPAYNCIACFSSGNASSPCTSYNMKQSSRLGDGKSIKFIRFVVTTMIAAVSANRVPFWNGQKFAFFHESSLLSFGNRWRPVVWLVIYRIFGLQWTHIISMYWVQAKYILSSYLVLARIL